MNESFSLGTLAGRTLVLSAVSETVQERTYVSSMVAAWSMIDLTEAPADGPIMVGVMHSDYTVTELEEFLENAGSWNEASLVQTREIGRRLIKKVGTFPSSGISGGAQVLNEGRPIKTKLGWVLTTGQTLDLWAYNLGTSALATTVPQVTVEGHANLWPL